MPGAPLSDETFNATLFARARLLRRRAAGRGPTVLKNTVVASGTELGIDMIQTSASGYRGSSPDSLAPTVTRRTRAPRYSIEAVSAPT